MFLHFAMSICFREAREMCRAVSPLLLPPQGRGIQVILPPSAFTTVPQPPPSALKTARNPSTHVTRPPGSPNAENPSQSHIKPEGSSVIDPPMLLETSEGGLLPKISVPPLASPPEEGNISETAVVGPCLIRKEPVVSLNEFLDVQSRQG